MTNQDFINKLNQFPKDKQVVFFCNKDVVCEEFIWNECYIEDIKECLYIEYDNRIYSNIDSLKNDIKFWEYFEDDDEIDKIINQYPKKEVIRIDLNIT